MGLSPDGTQYNHTGTTCETMNSQNGCIWMSILDDDFKSLNLSKSLIEVRPTLAYDPFDDY
jgi:hypothetical protein